MHSGTYARTDRHTHTYSYGDKHQSTNMEVRSKTLEVRNKECRACIDKRTHVRTNIWMHEHVRGQTDRQTDGWTDGRTDSHKGLHARACKHTNACTDERRHVRSNIWTHEHVCGQTDRQTDGQTDERTDGRTESHIRPHARGQAYTRTLACLHAHTMHSGTYVRTDKHTHTCSYGGKHPNTNMEVRSKKLEVRNKKCPYPAFVVTVCTATCILEASLTTAWAIPLYRVTCTISLTSSTTSRTSRSPAS